MKKEIILEEDVKIKDADERYHQRRMKVIRYEDGTLGFMIAWKHIKSWNDPAMRGFFPLTESQTKEIKDLLNKTFGKDLI